MHCYSLSRGDPSSHDQAKKVVQEIIRFCSVFGLPKVIQSDQGSNFTSKVFTQMLKELGIHHQLSSAYHPESQGALERFHQTLKSMLRKFCTETGRDWVEGLPLMMFAIREKCPGVNWIQSGRVSFWPHSERSASVTE